MSLFNTSRQDPLDSPTPAPSWWRWNPYRRAASPIEPTVGAGRAPWWRFDAYRRTNREEASAERAAYVDGARDAQGAQSELERRAYRQGELEGRRLEARRRRGHPVLAALVFVVALAGVGYVCLSYDEGSFTAGGAAIDEKIAEMKGDVGQAGVASGQAVQNTGADITARSQALTQSQPAQSPGG